MEVYNQIQYQNEQMMLYQAMQWQQQACMYNNMMQPAPQFEQEQKPAKKNGKRSYVQCELWKRQSLVEKVEKEGMTIKDAAKLLDINYSTAKHIIKVYRQTGEVETKIMNKRNEKSHSGEVQCEQVIEAQPQQPMNFSSQFEYPQMQEAYYDASAQQCQLPIDENMVDESFQAESFSDEERQNAHNFLFMSQYLN